MNPSPYLSSFHSPKSHPLATHGPWGAYSTVLPDLGRVDMGKRFVHTLEARLGAFWQDSKFLCTWRAFRQVPVAHPRRGAAKGGQSGLSSTGLFTWV